MTHAPHGRHSSYNHPQTNHDPCRPPHTSAPPAANPTKESNSASPPTLPTHTPTSPLTPATPAILTTDHCIIDQKTFFLRGCLEIPIIGHSEPFLWGLWAIVWEKDFDEIDDCWDSPGREKTHGPFQGRLANSLKDYPETLNLKLKIVLQTVGTRPLLYIEESEHPLAQEQQHGISYQLAMERASLYLHHRRTFR